MGPGLGNTQSELPLFYIAKTEFYKPENSPIPIGKAPISPYGISGILYITIRYVLTE